MVHIGDDGMSFGPAAVNSYHSILRTKTSACVQIRRPSLRTNHDYRATYLAQNKNLYRKQF
jgi:hypothetical protein